MNDEWTDAYSIIMPMLGFAVAVAGLSLSLLTLQRQQALGGTGIPSGVDVDVPRREVKWELHLQEEHAIRNLSLGDMGHVSLLCKARRSVEEPANVVILSDSDLTVEIRCADKVKRIRAAGGVEMRETI